MTCLVSSVLGVLTPKFSNITLKRYLSLGINRPWVLELWSLAKGTVILCNDETAICYFSCCVYLPDVEA
jgi:hypothetical protein